MIGHVECKKTGRKPRWQVPRAAVNVKLPEPLVDAAREQAAERGMSLLDFVGEALAQKTGVPYDTQEGLPLHNAS